MTEATDNLAIAISALAGAGAVNFAVANLADVSIAPALVALGPAAVGLASTLASDFNAKLAVNLTDLRNANPGLRITELDTFSLVNEIRADPQAFGLSNLTDPCALGNAGTGCADPDAYLFWDGLHPTTAAHQITADAAYAALVPVPAALWLCASAVLALAGVRRARSRH